MAYSSNLLCFLPLLLATSALAKRGLFAEYIGAENSVKFSDVPINSNVDFHFIVSFAIDYTHSASNPTPTNGHFSAFWDTDSLSPTQIAQIKQKHPNVKVAVSLGGATVANSNVQFHPTSVDSWVDNAVTSVTAMIKKYHFDGIDIDYENFKSPPSNFADAIGRLITTLKKNRVISFASIAPYNDDADQSNFSELWKRYGGHIDYVNYQFYSFSRHTTVPQFLQHFRTLSSQYDGEKLLASFSTDNSGGLKPANGFFTACSTLKKEGKLVGIAVWSADDSRKLGFRYETQAQKVLA